MHRVIVVAFLLFVAMPLVAQNSGPSAPSPPLPKVIPGPYAPAEVPEIKAVLDRILRYLESATPVQVVDHDTGQPVTDHAALPINPGLVRTEFLYMSHPWGVTYSGMLLTAEVTGDARYRVYVDERLEVIAAVAARQQARLATSPGGTLPADQRVLTMGPLVQPRSLDDCGSTCSALIKAAQADLHATALRPWIDRSIAWIHTEQSRLADGTLTRHRPHANTVWLDDLYMSVPALAQMGALTGEGTYFDDAVRQVAQFAQRLFVPERGLFRHGWVQDMNPHPSLLWARANGWAIVAMAELLSVLPENHPERGAVIKLYQHHAHSLASVQSAAGLWHQLLDRPDSYLETSASAMFTYAIARGVNRGWLEARAYGPMLLLAWNAVAAQVTAHGQVEGTCVGTGVGFDPAFYQRRPTSVLAAHAYGPVLLAGAETIAFRSGRGAHARLSDGAIQIMSPPSGP